MPQTIKQLLQQSQPIIDPLDTEILIAHVLHKPREFVLAHPEQNTTFTQQYTINKLIKKRQKGLPLAYLIGHKEFFGLDFLVNKHTLIPRPETELMVDEALKHLNTKAPKHYTIIDVGTGSGCIPISVIKTLKQNLRPELRSRENIKTFATDISQKALRVAKKNARKHNTNIEFLHGNLLEPIIQSSIFNLQSSIIITANLPYLTEEQFATEPSIQHEPKSALVADNQGLALYEKLLQQIQKLTAYNLQLTAFFEIDPSQSNPITSLIKNHLPNADIEIKKDLAGLDRLVIIKQKNLN